MESTDRELLLEINGRLVRIETRLDNLEVRVSALEERMTRQEIRMDRLEDKLDMLQTSVYWVFAGISILLGISTVFLAVLPFLKGREKNDAPKEKGLTISDVIALIKFSRKDEGD